MVYVSLSIVDGKLLTVGSVPFFGNFCHHPIQLLDNLHLGVATGNVLWLQGGGSEVCEELRLRLAVLEARKLHTRLRLRVATIVLRLHGAHLLISSRLCLKSGAELGVFLLLSEVVLWGPDLHASLLFDPSMRMLEESFCVQHLLLLWLHSRSWFRLHNFLSSIQSFICSLVDSLLLYFVAKFLLHSLHCFDLLLPIRKLMLRLFFIFLFLEAREHIGSGLSMTVPSFHFFLKEIYLFVFQYLLLISFAESVNFLHVDLSRHSFNLLLVLDQLVLAAVRGIDYPRVDTSDSLVFSFTSLFALAPILWEVPFYPQLVHSILRQYLTLLLRTQVLLGLKLGLVFQVDGRARWKLRLRGQGIILPELLQTPLERRNCLLWLVSQSILLILLVLVSAFFF